MADNCKHPTEEELVADNNSEEQLPDLKDGVRECDGRLAGGDGQADKPPDNGKASRGASSL